MDVDLWTLGSLVPSTVIQTNVCTLCNPHACTCCRFREKDFGSNDARRANQTRCAEGSGRQSTTEYTTTSLIRSVFHSNNKTPPLLDYWPLTLQSKTQLPALYQCFTPTLKHRTTSLIRSVFHSNTKTQNYFSHQVSVSLPTLKHRTTSLIRSVFHSNTKTELPPLSGQCFTPTLKQNYLPYQVSVSFQHRKIQSYLPYQAIAPI